MARDPAIVQPTAKDEQGKHVIARNLLQLRHIRGLTQMDLAKLVGMIPQCLASLEKAVHKPSIDTIDRLAAGLNVSQAELVCPQSDWIAPAPYAERGRDILARNVRRLRLEAGLSQPGLSRLTGIHNTTISSIEAARYGPTIDTIERLAAAFGVSSAILLTPSEPPGRDGHDLLAS